MGRHAGEFPFLDGLRGDGRIMQQAELVVVPAVEVQEVGVVRETDSQSEGAEDVLSRAETGPVEGGHEGLEGGEEGRRGPDVGLGGVVFGTDFITFLLRRRR